MGHVRLGFVALVGLLAVALARPAQGQLVGLNHIWTVPGVVNTSSGLATYISCSNAGTAGQTIGVDVYGPSGAYVNGNSIAVAPNSTVLFGTASSTALSVDVNLGTGPLSKGLAQVLATGKSGVLCSAFIADGTAALPTSMVSLTIAKKTKQKGD